MVPDPPRAWKPGEPFPHSHSRVDRAGAAIRRLGHEELVPSDADFFVAEDFRTLHVEPTRTIQGSLVQFFHQMAEIPEDQLAIGSRLKTRDAIVAKLLRSTVRLSKMQDIAGARVVVPTLPVQDAVVEAIAGLYADALEDVKDQRASPDAHGYRAVHLIVQTGDVLGEIQVRTLWQDRWAQLVEGLDSDFSSDLKHGVGDAEWLQWLREMSDQMRKADLGEPYWFPPLPTPRQETE